MATAAAGCDQADYYLHLARGQGRILWARRPVAQVAADPQTPEAVRAALALLSDIRRFASDRVGLDASSSYTTYFDTGGAPVAWNVSASPPDRFESYRWTFPIVGALPYKGFFAADRAAAERDRLRASGFDAIARAVSAYSTLGILSDPFLSTMVDDSEQELADLVLHELTHAAVYVEDTDYSESAATFIGQAGSIAFLEERHGRDSAPVLQARRELDEARRFNAFLHGVVDRLDSLYRRGRPRDEVLGERARLFAASQDEYRRRRQELGGGRYDGFESWEVNNARLLSYRRYHTGLDRLEAVLTARGGDLAATLQALVACGEEDDPWACLKEDE